MALAFYDSGCRSFYNSKRTINTPADLKGMKVRVIQSDLFLDMVNALGANATPMPPGEVYSALQTGVVDGAENNWPSYDSFRHFEVAKFYSLTEHSMSPEVLVMPEEELRQALAGRPEGGTRNGEGIRREDARALGAARRTPRRIRASGSQINNVDKQPFIDAMKPVYEKYAKDAKVKELVSRIQAMN